MERENKKATVQVDNPKIGNLGKSLTYKNNRYLYNRGEQQGLAA